MAGFTTAPKLTIAQQAFSLQRAQRQSICRFTGHSGFIWLGALQPTPLSARYRVRVRYRLGHFPETTVVEPTLQPRDGKPIPHMYEATQLCLFHPANGEWNRAMKIAETILPWASLWLYYYELWHATGEWLGGGEHP